MDDIVRMMIGREIGERYPKRENIKIGDEMIRVEGLTKTKTFNNVNFSVKAGEILGVSGLMGAGRTEIMRAIFGVDYIKSLNVYIRGEKVKITDPASAKKHGIAFLTEDRKVEGLTLEGAAKRLKGDRKEVISKARVLESLKAIRSQLEEIRSEL